MTMLEWEQKHAGQLLHGYEGHDALPVCGSTDARRLATDPFPRTTYVGLMPPPDNLICQTCKTWERDHDPMFIAGRAFERSSAKPSDPLWIENRALDEQERWLEKLAAGSRETSEENHLVVQATRALRHLREYRAGLKETIAAARPLAKGGAGR